MTTELKARLQSDLTAAIRSRDEIRSATLRMALTAVKTEEVAGTATRDLTDDEVVAVLGREAKKRREAATAFSDAGRVAQADRERAELVVLQSYLPKQLTDEQISVIVLQAVGEVAAQGRSGPSAMGAVMKLVQPQVAGQADGGRVAAEVKRQLAG